MGGEWNDSGIVGMSRWLHRVWNLVTGDYSPKTISPETEKELNHIMHQTIKRVTEDMERFRFNTMLAALMEFTNYLGKLLDEGSVSVSIWKEATRILLLLLAPSVPHLAEELWGISGYTYSIHNQSWPAWDESLAKAEEITLVIQVNGKVRDKVIVSASITEAEAKELALSSERVKTYLNNKQPAKVIYIPGKLVNVVLQHP
jgi:leucyl-tRNA synthetase